MQFEKSKPILIFPGQGSQRLGMLKDYADSYSQVKETFQAMSDICHQDLWRIVQQGPQEKLDDTQITQPVMFAADMAIYKVWQAVNAPAPGLVAGHSLGEYAALVASGILSFEDAGKLVSHRSRLMAASYPNGEGAVGVIVPASESQVHDWCQACSNPDAQMAHQAWIANINSQTQIVIAGHKAAVTEVLQLAKQNQVKMAALLPVSVPVHCPMMKDAADQLKVYFDEVTLHTPSIPMIFNVDACFHQEPQDIKKALYEQLFKPVQWLKSMNRMMESQPSVIAESGPGGVLTGLLKRSFKESHCKMLSLSSVIDLQEWIKNESGA
jgi:[acyl-carrier-protein] S-malonyltransferase